MPPDHEHEARHTRAQVESEPPPCALAHLFVPVRVGEGARRERHNVALIVSVSSRASQREVAPGLMYERKLGLLERLETGWKGGPLTTPT